MVNKQLIEQKITQQVTIAAGASDTVSVAVPTNGKAFLKGYGYTYFDDNTFKLTAGTYSLPSRTDQEGSTSIPVMYGNPFPANSGESFSLAITNGDSSDHTYDVVFYVLSDRVIEVDSVGGELILTTGGSGGVSSAVSITDATGTTSAGVTADGLEVHIDKALPAGTNKIGNVVLTNAAGSETAEVVTRGDGVKALAVDTELVIDGATVNIENVFNASTDLAVSGAGYILMDSNNRLEVVSGEARSAAHTAPTMGTATAAALAVNTSRTAALFINDSDTIIYLNIGSAGVLNTGIRLNANGGSFEMSKELGNLSTAAINGISSAASKNLLVTEWS